MKIKLTLSVILLLSLLLSACGCQKSTSYNLSYREKNFCARVEGNQFGVDFSCDISCEGGRATKIVYSSPESLKGVTVHLLENGEVKLEQDNISAIFSINVAHMGLLLPARRLLLDGFSPSSVQTVQKISGGFYLTIVLPNESQTIFLSLTQNGLPSAMHGSDFSYRVYFYPENQNIYKH